MSCGCVLAVYLGLSQLANSPPRTVRFEIETWQNNSWGFHDIDRREGWGTVAIYGDGSRVNKVSANGYEHYFFPNYSYTLHNIYRRGENIVYLIDDRAKTATLSRCRCTWNEPVRPATDRECETVAKSYPANRRVRVGEGRVAGILVIRYWMEDDVYEHERAFAPEFGCEELEETSTSYNKYGLPTSRFHFIVRSYVAGEPNRADLLPPLGYTLLEEH